MRELIAQGQLGDYLARRYPERHDVRNDGALYEHAMALKQRYLRNAPLLSKVAYDNRLQIDQRALGTLTAVSRVQGGQLKAKREIRVAALFKDAPAADAADDRRARARAPEGARARQGVLRAVRAHAARTITRSSSTRGCT